MEHWAGTAWVRELWGCFGAPFTTHEDDGVEWLPQLAGFLTEEKNAKITDT